MTDRDSGGAPQNPPDDKKVRICIVPTGRGADWLAECLPCGERKAFEFYPNRGDQGLKAPMEWAKAHVCVSGRAEPTDRRKLADFLKRHVMRGEWMDGDAVRAGCLCGWKSPYEGSKEVAEGHLAEHVADALASYLTQEGK